MTRGWRACVVVGLGVLAVASVTRTPWARQILIDRVAAYLHDRYGLVLQVDRVDLRAIALAATLDGFTLAPLSSPDQPFIRAERVEIDLSAHSLLGRWSFDRVVIVRPVLSFDLTTGTRASLPADMAAPDLDIGELDIRDLTLDWTGAKGARIVVRQLSATVRGDGAAPSAEIEVTGATSIDAPPLHAKFDRMSAQVSMRRGSVLVLSMDGRSDVADLQVAGSLSILGSRDVDLRYQFGLALERPYRFSEDLPPVSGHVRVQGTVTGTQSDPVATFHVRGDGLQWSRVQYARLEAAGELSKAGLFVSTSELSAAQGSIRARGHVTARPDETSRVTADWSVPDLRTWSSLLGSEAGIPHLDLAVSGTTEWAWRGLQPTIASSTATSRATVRAGVAPETAVATLAVDADGRDWTLRVDSTLAGNTTAVARVSTQLTWPVLSRSPIGGEIEWRSTDVSAAADQLRALGLPVPPSDEWNRRGELAAIGTFGGTILDPHVRATLTGAVGSTPLDHVAAHATLTADTRALTVESLTLEARDGRIETSGRVDFGEQTTSGAFEARVDRLEALAVILPPDWHPMGTLSASGRWSGTWHQPHVTAHLRGSGIGAAGARFDEVTSDLELAGTMLRVPNLSFRRAQGWIHVGGWVDLAARKFSADLRAQGVDFASTDGHEVEPPLPQAGGFTLPQVSDLSLSARLEGALDGTDLTGAHFALDVFELEGRLLGRSFALQDAFAATYSDRTATFVSPAHLTSGSAVFNLSGSLGGPSSNHVSVAIDDRIDEWLQLLPERGAQELWTGEGSVRVRARVGGPLNDPQLSAELSASIATLLQGEREVARDFTARATLAGEALHIIDVSGRALGGELHARGRVPLVWLAASLASGADHDERPSREAASLSGTWQIDLGTASSALGFGGAQLGGKATLSLEATAPHPRLDAVEASLTGEIEQITARTIPLLERAPLSLRLSQGRLFVDALDWQSREARISVSGAMGIAPDTESDLVLRGRSALQLVDHLFPVRASGQVSVDLHLTGAPGAADASGTIGVADVSLIVPKYHLALAGWSGTLALTPDRVEARGLGGQLNGGAVDVEGGVSWEGRDVVPTLDIRARDIFAELAHGLRTQFDADIALRGQEGGTRVSGVVSLTADAYRERASEIASAVAALTAGAGGAPVDLPAWLADAALDVRLETTGPLVIENRMAQVELVPALTLAGTLNRPALNGRIDIAQDGRLQVAGRTYRLTESALEFSAANALLPRLNVSGQTKVGSYDVILRLSGPADEIETSLSSNPPLSERDLQSLLLTGQATAVTGASEGDSQFVVDAVSAEVLGFAGQFVGLDSIQLGTDDFEIVSDDVKAARRLTASKRLGSRFELLFSENLDDDELTWIIVYRPRTGYEFRVSSRENVEQGLEFRREITLGPGVSTPRTAARTKVERETIVDVSVTGQPGFRAEDVLEVVKLREGRQFDFTEWWHDRDRIEKYYVDRGFFGVRVVPTRTATGGTPRSIRLEYRIIRGPRTELAVTGYDAPPAFVDLLRATWSETQLAEFLPEVLTAAAQRHLTEQGYLRARIEVEVGSPEGDTLRTLIRVTPGPKTATRRIAFSGNEAIAAAELDRLVEPLAVIEAWIDPAPMLDAIEAEYEARGYASARAQSSEPQFAGTTATLPVVISEGPPTRVGGLRLAGVGPDRDDEVRAVLELTPGVSITATAVRQARIRLERHYRNQGYRDAQVTASVRVEADSGLADLLVDVAEGPLYTVRGVRIDGRQSTRESLVRSAVTLVPGAAASPAAASDTERRLYGLGVLRTATVRFEPVESPSLDRSTTQVDALVTVEESRRYQLRFGVETSSEYEPALQDRTNAAGFAVDFRDRNFLGRALSLGVGTRYEPSLQSIRTMFAVPRLRSVPVRTNVYGLWRQEEERHSSGVVLRDYTRELTIEQRWQPRRSVDLAWGYNLDWRDLRVLTPETGSSRGFDGVLGSVYSSVSIDRRDSALDATRGWFQSASAQWGLKALGSSLDFLRMHIRSSYYHPLGPVVLASTARLGSLVSGAGSPGPNLEDVFFKAGGTQSVRGYAEDALSAIEFEGIPLGGPRLLVASQEMRFPIAWRLGGVLFADAGNTFDTGGIVFSDLALGLGFGLRIRTPLAPIRLDLAWPLPQRQQASPRWHFSIGQMF